jgi:hypothetical protein
LKCSTFLPFTPKPGISKCYPILIVLHYDLKFDKYIIKYIYYLGSSEMGGEEERRFHPLYAESKRISADTAQKYNTPTEH